LTRTLHDLQLQLSPPLPSSLDSIEPANQGSPGKTERDMYLYKSAIASDGSCFTVYYCFYGLVAAGVV